MPALEQVVPFAVPAIAGALVAVAILAVVWATRSVRYIPNHRVGVVEKLWSSRGSVPDGLIALLQRKGYRVDQQ